MDNPFIDNLELDIKKAVCYIVDTYGATAQTDIMIEEMSELTKALLKFRRKIRTNDDISAELDNVMEELADVQIMLWQIAYAYSAYPFHAFYTKERKLYDITSLICDKLNRQITRIRTENGGGR